MARKSVLTPNYFSTTHFRACHGTTARATLPPFEITGGMVLTRWKGLT